NGAFAKISSFASLAGKDRASPGQRRTKTSPKSDEEHSPAAITAERLHGGVVNDTHRFAKGFFKIESRPSFAEIFWIGQNAAVPDRGGKANRDDIVLPVVEFTVKHGVKVPGSEVGV